MNNITLKELEQKQTIANLRRQGCEDADILRLKSILQFSEGRKQDVSISWVPSRVAGWTVSPSFEEVERGTRRPLIGWGETLPNAINDAWRQLHSGKTFATYQMATDRRRWGWNNERGVFEQWNG